MIETGIGNGTVNVTLEKEVVALLESVIEGDLDPQEDDMTMKLAMLIWSHSVPVSVWTVAQAKKTEIGTRDVIQIDMTETGIGLIHIEKEIRMIKT